MMILSLALPLLFSSELYTAPIKQEVIEETQQVHIEEKDKDECTDPLGCNCVSYVRSRGVNLPPADAIDLVPNDIPRVGGVVIMRYDHPGYSVGHVAYIEAIDSEGIHIAESNVTPGKIDRRVLRPDNIHIVGYAYY